MITYNIVLLYIIIYNYLKVKRNFNLIENLSAIYFMPQKILPRDFVKPVEVFMEN